MVGGDAAVLAVQSGLVRNKRVSADYAGDAGLRSSVSPEVVVTGKDRTATARPFDAFFAGSRALTAKGARMMNRPARSESPIAKAWSDALRRSG
jgi:hypothetical protein